MDHTMVGDLVALSDRDNIETNVPWTYWPEVRTNRTRWTSRVRSGRGEGWRRGGRERQRRRRGSSDAQTRGRTRACRQTQGLLELITSLRGLGATIVVRKREEEEIVFAGGGRRRHTGGMDNREVRMLQVYTHSEEKWAIKVRNEEEGVRGRLTISQVCEAMERVAGMPFIKRIFSR
eukprot:747702-Hanusia_phi.AAC.3